MSHDQTHDREKYSLYDRMKFEEEEDILITTTNTTRQSSNENQ